MLLNVIYIYIAHVIKDFSNINNTLYLIKYRENIFMIFIYVWQHF